MDSLNHLIEADESHYRNQIQQAAHAAFSQNARFLFLAGPSCSGKTTTSLALAEALIQKGKRVLTFSTDDFFFDQHTAPKNEDGTPNYDAFEHTDSALLISVLQHLAAGKETILPTFDFVSGTRNLCGVFVRPQEYDVFLLEGIHGLNDVFLNCLPGNEPKDSFYLTVTKAVSSSEHAPLLSPEQIRFCRRLIRDFKHRNATAERTFPLWKNVLRSEKEILIPYRKNSLFTIESNFRYEIAVEKNQILPLLEQVPVTSPYYSEARLLIDTVAPFPSLPKEVVPKNSVIREFID